MNLALEPARQWDLPPHTLLATFDESTVVVWQAHGARVADAVLARGSFDVPEFRSDRTSRLRVSLPSLLFRCRWGTREGRERILAVRLRREGFDELRRRAVVAEDDRAVYPSTAAWRLALRYASATVSWHPDRDPSGAELSHSTARFGLRDTSTQQFARRWVTSIEDVTPWVSRQRDALDRTGTDWPAVRPYPGGSDVR